MTPILAPVKAHQFKVSVTNLTREGTYTRLDNEVQTVQLPVIRYYKPWWGFGLIRRHRLSEMILKRTLQSTHRIQAGMEFGRNLLQVVIAPVDRDGKQDGEPLRYVCRMVSSRVENLENSSQETLEEEIVLEVVLVENFNDL